jgi:hypothetical protein
MRASITYSANINADNFSSQYSDLENTAQGKDQEHSNLRESPRMDGVTNSNPFKSCPAELAVIGEMNDVSNGQDRKHHLIIHLTWRLQEAFDELPLFLFLDSKHACIHGILPKSKHPIQSVTLLQPVLVPALHLIYRTLPFLPPWCWLLVLYMHDRFALHTLNRLFPVLIVSF